jgi:hypothetical protein
MGTPMTKTGMVEPMLFSTTASSMALPLSGKTCAIGA